MIEDQVVEKKRSRRLYWLWGISLTLLAALAIFCWLVVVPVLRVRAAVERCASWRVDQDPFAQMRSEIERLGGQATATRGLRLYLLLSQRLAPHRVTATTMLGECGSQAVPMLLRLLEDGDWHVRLRAAGALGAIRDARAVGPLIATLRDDDADVRYQVAQALGVLGDARATVPLVALLGDESENVRGAAAFSLGQIGDRRATEPLAVVLKDGGEIVRALAATALGMIGDTRAVEPLIASLKDRDELGRMCAARALGELGDPRAVEPLKATLNDKDPSVRQAAAEALKKIRAKGSPESGVGSPEEKRKGK